MLSNFHKKMRHWKKEEIKERKIEKSKKEKKLRKKERQKEAGRQEKKIPCYNFFWSEIRSCMLRKSVMACCASPFFLWKLDNITTPHYKRQEPLEL